MSSGDTSGAGRTTDVEPLVTPWVVARVSGPSMTPTVRSGDRPTAVVFDLLSIALSNSAGTVTSTVAVPAGGRQRRSTSSSGPTSRSAAVSALAMPSVIWE